jgi:N-acetylneuraminate synthase
MSESEAQQSILIGDRPVGPSDPVFIIAEAGVNHNGDVAMARQLVDVAADAGADAVKFQTFRAENLATEAAPKAEYQLRHTEADESQFAMLKRLELSREAHRMLSDHCRQRGIIFLSTPFDEEAADLLFELDVPAFKVSSGDLTNLPLLAHIARKGKPVILSTGMSNLDEVTDAVRAINDAGGTQLVLMQCVTNYPARPEDVNLRAMQTMRATFHLPVGYSDHTEGMEVALAAAALGASVIEKHLTLNRNLPGPDHAASLEPRELAALVSGIRKVESALGHGRKECAASELETARVARRSLTAARDIIAGTRLTREMIAARRPGTGLPPAMLPQLIGRTLRANVEAGSMFALEMLE